ncbi:MAG: hypothetical protein IKK39_10280, partial [Thermoguttaceae bacterium]|nr:hypothetical protein [Thermoguttaceae bacterium]
MKKFVPFSFSSISPLSSLAPLRLSVATLAAVAVVGLADFAQTAPFDADFAPVAVRAADADDSGVVWAPLYRGVEYSQLFVETP